MLVRGWDVDVGWKAGTAYSTRSQAHSMLSREVVGGSPFPIGLGGPTTPTPFPLLLLRDLFIKRLIL